MKIRITDEGDSRTSVMVVSKEGKINYIASPGALGFDNHQRPLLFLILFFSLTVNVEQPLNNLSSLQMHVHSSTSNPDASDTGTSEYQAPSEQVTMAKRALCKGLIWQTLLAQKKDRGRRPS